MVAVQNFLELINIFGQVMYTYGGIFAEGWRSPFRSESHQQSEARFAQLPDPSDLIVICNNRDRAAELQAFQLAGQPPGFLFQYLRVVTLKLYNQDRMRFAVKKEPVSALFNIILGSIQNNMIDQFGSSRIHFYGYYCRFQSFADGREVGNQNHFFVIDGIQIYFCRSGHCQRTFTPAKQFRHIEGAPILIKGLHAAKFVQGIAGVAAYNFGVRVIFQYLLPVLADKGNDLTIYMSLKSVEFQLSIKFGVGERVKQGPGPVVEYGFYFKDMFPRGLMFNGERAAGIVADHSPQHAAIISGRVWSKKQVVFGCFPD